MYKDIEVVEFGSSEYTELIARETRSYGGFTLPMQTTLEAIAKRCKSVVIEKDYVDKDFQDEYAAYYSKAFKTYSPRCTRLHFFSTSIAPTNKYDFSKYSQESYLGFVVLRPTDLQRMGRTVLRPLIGKPDINFITCVAPYSAHLFGREFQINAMPFIQQDTQVGVCAQASLWMLGRYMSRRFNYREFLPAEINQFAKSHTAEGRLYPAEKGLTRTQMLDALQAMGLSATFYEFESMDGYENYGKQFAKVFPVRKKSTRDRNRTAKLADIAYRYIESKLPVIFTTTDHALVGIGHSYDYKKKAKMAIERIPSFFVNNDAAGPYLEMPIFSKKRGLQSFSRADNIIVVMPHEATLCGEEAENTVRSWIDLLLAQPSANLKRGTLRDDLIRERKEFRRYFKRLEYRTYLIPSVQLQEELMNELAHKPTNQVAATLLQIDYPKFIWITEVSCAELLNFADKTRRKCLGRVIVDSTAPKNTNSLIALHFADILTIWDRQGKKAPDPFHVPYTTPFVHRFTTRIDERTTTGSSAASASGTNPL
ncbi:MAG TPA: hypothetical protein VJ063_07930 [Verrucomicrobiae bacterium]|nr:hypothetical protein [Verrucomicrobiae bacterium]